MSRDYNDADEFLSSLKNDNEEKWAYLEEEFPVLSKNDYIRAKIGEPIDRKRKREGSKGVKKGRKWDDDDWTEIREKRRQYYRDYIEDERYAKELADQGM